MLDIAHAKARLTKKQNATNDAKENSPKVLYVAPNPETLPDDGFLQYVVIADVYDLKDLEPRSVVLFQEDTHPILEVVGKHQELFGVQLITLLGVPRAEYSPKFDSLVWNLPRVAYGPYISELALAIEARESAEAASATLHDKERATYVRASGNVKEHDPLVLRSPGSGPDEEVQDEVDEVSGSE